MPVRFSMITNSGDIETPVSARILLYSIFLISYILSKHLFSYQQQMALRQQYFSYHITGWGVSEVKNEISSSVYITVTYL